VRKHIPKRLSARGYGIETVQLAQHSFVTALAFKLIEAATDWAREVTCRAFVPPFERRGLDISKLAECYDLLEEIERMYGLMPDQIQRRRQHMTEQLGRYDGTYLVQVQSIVRNDV